MAPPRKSPDAKRQKPGRSGRKRAPAPSRAPAPNLAALDEKAGAALRAMDGDVHTQQAALQAMTALAEECHAALPHGVLARAVAQFLEERRAAVRALHLDRVERACTRHALLGASETSAVLQVIDDALRMLTHLEGESATVRSLRGQREDVLHGRGGLPRPFFARYLEPQQRG